MSQSSLSQTSDDAAQLSLATADKHLLYQWSVQSPDADLDFATRLYRARQKRQPRHFREDFCGTGLMTATWIARGRKYTAEGFDIDPEPLAWGQKYNFAPLGEDRARAVMHQADVRTPSLRPPDLRCAQNFSWFVFKTRPELLEYFTAAYRDLAPGGVFFLDIFGGPQAVEAMEEETEMDEGFTYVWNQVEFWPVTGEYLAKIHFNFPDGTRMEDAFTYNWRLWSVPEAVEVLRDAGFAKIDVYWEQIGEDGIHGNGIYKRSKRGDNWLSWVAYIVGHKPAGDNPAE